MATEIYLGPPPPHIIDWIKAHSKPAANPKTKITFRGGTSQEYEWSGEINQQTMMATGLYNYEEFNWPNDPQTVEIGTKVTIIGSSAFNNCRTLTTVIIPNSVTSIGFRAFAYCNFKTITIPDSVISVVDEVFYHCYYLTSVTFSGKDKATVQNMGYYPWGLTSGCVIHCTDGDITI